jgi:quercetin dioxygenase-like cupin family protein
MIPPDVEALALADAVGALDPDEQRDWIETRASLPLDVQQRVAQLYDSALLVAALADDVAPDPGVRTRVLAAAKAPTHYAVLGGDGGWVDTPLPGIQVKILAIDRERQRATLLIKGGPGAAYPSHHHSGPEECYVLRGSIHQDGREFRAGDFIHADEGSDHGEITTVDGAEVLLVAALADYLPDLARA